MKCVRCGNKGITCHDLQIHWQSGNSVEYSLCDRCLADIESYIDHKPNYNIHGYNLDKTKFYEGENE